MDRLCPICYHINLMRPGETSAETVVRLGADLYNLLGVINLERLDREVERSKFSDASIAASEMIRRIQTVVEDQREEIDSLKTLELEITKLGDTVSIEGIGE